MLLHVQAFHPDRNWLHRWRRHGLILLLALFHGHTLYPADSSLPSPPTTNSAVMPACSSGLSRWLDLQTGTLTLRYKWEKDSEIPIRLSQVQYNVLFRLRLKFDSRGRFSLIAGGGSGRRFNFGWNSTGIGTGDLVTNLYLRQLHISAVPVQGFEIQYGGFGFVRGESTDITSFNLNGYLMGQRLSLKRPQQFFFDEISLTGGYLGDFFNPSVIGRFHRLSQVNYYHFLVLKHNKDRVSFSADYTSQEGAQTLRQAIKIQFKSAKFLDTFLFENYQRLDVNPAWGFSSQVQKTLNSKFTLAGGISDIDKNYGPWNSDRLGKGRRFFLIGSLPIGREFTLTGLVTQAFATNFPVVNHTRFEVGIGYDFASRLNRSRLF